MAGDATISEYSVVLLMTGRMDWILVSVTWIVCTIVKHVLCCCSSYSKDTASTIDGASSAAAAVLLLSFVLRIRNRATFLRVRTTADKARNAMQQE